MLHRCGDARGVRNNIKDGLQKYVARVSVRSDSSKAGKTLENQFDGITMQDWKQMIMTKVGDRITVKNPFASMTVASKKDYCHYHQERHARSSYGSTSRGMGPVVD